MFTGDRETLVEMWRQGVQKPALCVETRPNPSFCFSSRGCLGWEGALLAAKQLPSQGHPLELLHRDGRAILLVSRREGWGRGAGRWASAHCWRLVLSPGTGSSPLPCSPPRAMGRPLSSPSRALTPHHSRGRVP